MIAISWTYPQDELIALHREQEAAAAAAPIASGLSVESLDFDYAIAGDKPAWRPLRAFDDGHQTFIEFPASLAVGEAPPLFVIGDDGEAQLVNYRVAGRYYVVDRLFGAAELRLGAKKQQTVTINRTGSRQPARGRAGRAL
jgi:type IV secretion system protein VirB9